MKKRFLAFLLVTMLLVSCAATALAYDIDTAKGSIVRLDVYVKVDDPRADPSLLPPDGLIEFTGSGFAVGDISSNSVDYIVTAGHVVMHNVESGNMADTTCYLPVSLTDYAYLHVNIVEIRVLINDRSSYVLAQVAGVSDRADVAVVRLNTPISDRKAAVLLNKSDFPTNASLTSMGFPSASEVNLTGTVNDQMISNTSSVTTNHGFFSRYSTHAVTNGGDQIQTTAEMSFGMSGGALVDDDGYVVGVCTSGASSTDNVNYAVATSEIVRLLNSLTDAKYTLGPVASGLSTTMIIIIVAAILVIILLIVLIILAQKGKKSSRVLVFGGSLGGREVQLKKGTPVVVGRDPAKCQVVYAKDTAGVSGSHCTITFDGNEVTVADNGSTYGTFVGGVKVEPGRPVVMHRGQEITFGSDKNKAELH